MYFSAIRIKSVGLFLILFVSLTVNLMSQNTEKSIILSKSLLSVPLWTDIPPDKEYTHEKDLFLALNKADEMSVKEVRKTIQDMFGSVDRNKSKKIHDEFVVWCRVFVLNRYYANVPEWESLDNLEGFGGWLGIPRIKGKVNMLFPLAINEAGDFYLAGRLGKNGFMGPAYRGLDEFDYLIKKYGVRKFQKKK